MTLSVGKLRGLQQCTTPDGLFLMMAIDHRNGLRSALNPTNPDSISYSEMALFKTEVTRALSTVSSAVLLDPEFGAAQAIAAHAITGSCGLIVALEASSSADKTSLRKAHILPGWSVEQISRMRAEAVKFMLAYNPKAKNAEDQELLIREVAAMCLDYDIPFLLEPVPYSPDSAVKNLSAEEESSITLESAHRLSSLGADVYVAALPAEADEPIFSTTCAALSKTCTIPWVLRSSSPDFGRFLRQTEIASRAGASGVMAGSAVWAEAVELRGDDQIQFLYKTAVERMVELGDVISEYATSWTDIFQSSLGDIPSDWYETY